MAKKALLQGFGDVDFRLLRVFRTVARCGGLAASEFELNIGRSTISRHISDLEVRLGMTLCYRGPAGFSLSGEGEKVLEATEMLLAAVDGFQNEVDDIHRNMRGTFKLAFFDLSSTNPMAHVHAAIARFEAVAPEVNLELSTEPPNVIEAGVINGRYDLGIVPVHRQSAVLSYADLYSEEMILYCGQGHPCFDGVNSNLDLKQLSAFKYAGFGFNSPNMVVGQRMNFKISARVHNEEALCVLIQSGKYLGFLPDHVAGPYVAADIMRPVEQDKIRYTTQLAAIVRKRPELNRKTDEFLRCLLQAHGLDGGVV